MIAQRIFQNLTQLTSPPVSGNRIYGPAKSCTGEPEAGLSPTGNKLEGRSPAPVASKPRLVQPDRDLLTQQRFYQRCDRFVQILILRCTWQIIWRSGVPVLTISCSNTFLYGQILHEIQALALRPLHPDAKIRIYRPLGWIFPLEIKVDEILTTHWTER